MAAGTESFTSTASWASGYNRYILETVNILEKETNWGILEVADALDNAALAMSSAAADETGGSDVEAVKEFIRHFDRENKLTQEQKDNIRKKLMEHKNGE
jgi:20S proteasome alpha/beta subunit